MQGIYKQSGGYRKLYSFTYATIVHLGAMEFCKKFISWKDDPLGKTVGQMIGASRSSKQNIIEGSVSAQTSTETEIKLTNVAKASFAELAGDLEDYLLARNEVPWSIHAAQHQAISAIRLAPFAYTDDVLHDYGDYLLSEKKKFDPWLKQDDAVVCANALLVLTMKTMGMLGRQLNAQEELFVEAGEMRERMKKARLQRRKTVTPVCPECGKPMRIRKSKQGDFWGCSGYPECHGTRPDSQ